MNTCCSRYDPQGICRQGRNCQHPAMIAPVIPQDDKPIVDPYSGTFFAAIVLVSLAILSGVVCVPIVFLWSVQ